MRFNDACNHPVAVVSASRQFIAQNSYFNFQAISNPAFAMPIQQRENANQGR